MQYAIRYSSNHMCSAAHILDVAELKFNPLFQIGKILKTPKVKFWSSVCSFFAFVIMVVTFTATEVPSSGRLYSQLVAINPQIENETSAYKYLDGNMFVRVHAIGYGTIVMTIWILGKACQCWNNSKRAESTRSSNCHQ